MVESPGVGLIAQTQLKFELGRKELGVGDGRPIYTGEMSGRALWRATLSLLSLSWVKASFDHVGLATGAGATTAATNDG